MILCPNCKHKELEGTLFCGECGTQLTEADSLATQMLRQGSTSSLSMVVTAPQSSPLGDTQTGPDTIVSLHFVDSGQVLHLKGRMKYSLGRIVEGQPTSPDVDLTPYEAYGKGVSRVHALLKVISSHVYIIDLGSSNGTRVNGQKITPRTEFPLNHGDVLALGKLKMQFLIRK